MFRQLVLAGLSLAMAAGFPAASWCWENYQAADVVIGQPDMVSNRPNQGLLNSDANTLAYPSGIYAAGGKLFVSDMNNFRVLIFNQFPAVNNARADVVLGQLNMTSNLQNFDNDKISATPQRFSYTNSLCSDGEQLCISDFVNHRILLYKQIPAQNGAAADIAVGQADLWHNFSNQIQNDNSPTAISLSYPEGVNRTSSKLFIADTNNNRLLIYDPVPTTHNAQALLVIGQKNMVSNKINQGLPNADAETLNQPQGVFCDGTRIFIADSKNNRVLIFNSIPNSPDARADVVIGQSDMWQNQANQGKAAPAANTLNQPNSLCFDGASLFVADWLNNRVLIYNSVPNTHNAQADIVIGRPDMQSPTANDAVGGTNERSLFKPEGVYSSGAKLFVTDSGNNRTLIFNYQSPATPVSAAVDNQIKAVPSRINPARQETTAIRWYQAEACATTITIYNLRGELIKTLVNQEFHAKGQRQQVIWKGENGQGHTVASGIYLVRIKAGTYDAYTKVAVIK